MPMVGFGFMDNIIMIQAGDLIDSTLGVTLGLSTMAAAAWGNVCSDSSGVLFGGVVESLSDRLKLARPDLTPAQRLLRSVRFAGTLGSLVGVIFGCVCGMCTLPFLDHERADRLKRAQELETVFTMVVSNGQGLLNAQRSTLYLYDEARGQLWSKTSINLPEPFYLELDLNANALACHSARSRHVLNVADAYKDPRFDPSWDGRTGYTTKQVLCMPIAREDGTLLGCLQAVNKIDGDRFTENDEKLMSMMCAHIKLFLAQGDAGSLRDQCSPGGCEHDVRNYKNR